MKFFAAVLVVTVLLAPTQPYTKNVVLLVDCSGSMDQGKLYPHAVEAARSQAEQSLDEMNLCVIAFDDVPTTWGEGKKTQGWVKLPSARKVEAAKKWLQSLKVAGGTKVIPALQVALMKKREELTVVLVTDGGFYQEQDERILEGLETAQRWREKQGLGRAVVGVIGVGNEKDVLHEIAKAGGGGYRLVHEKKEKPTVKRRGPF